MAKKSPALAACKESIAIYQRLIQQEDRQDLEPQLATALQILGMINKL